MISVAINNGGPIGCTYWRQLLPVRHLAAELRRRGVALKFGRMAGRPDVVVMSRYPAFPMIPVLVGLKQAGALLVWDLDDDLLDPARFADRLDLKLQRVAALKLCLNLADLITVSTLHLADVVGYAAKTVVCPNLIDLVDYPVDDTGPENRDVILFAGSPSHEKDLLLVRDLYHATKRHFRWVFYGVHPTWGDRHSVSLDWGTVGEYAKVCATFRPLVCICPLQPCKFNESKSPIKVWESATYGAQVLASDTGPYRGHPAALVPEGEPFTVEHLEAVLAHPNQPACLAVARANSWQHSAPGVASWRRVFDMTKAVP